MRTFVIIILSVVFLSQSVLAEPELKGTASELSQYLAEVPKTAVLTSTSELKIPADSAILRIRIETESSTLENAMQLNQNVRNAIEDRLAAKGIIKDRIMASSISTTSERDWLTKKTNSYNVKNFIKITIHNDNEFQEVAKLVDEYKDVYYVGIKLEHSDKEKIKLQALRKACESNLKKKAIYEDVFGVVLTVNTFHVHDQFISIAPTNQSNTSGEGMQVGTYANTSNPFYSRYTAFGELLVTANVTVEYQVTIAKAENK